MVGVRVRVRVMVGVRGKKGVSIRVRVGVEGLGSGVRNNTQHALATPLGTRSIPQGRGTIETFDRWPGIGTVVYRSIGKDRCIR